MIPRRGGLFGVAKAPGEAEYGAAASQDGEAGVEREPVAGLSMAVLARSPADRTAGAAAEGPAARAAASPFPRAEARSALVSRERAGVAVRARSRAFRASR